tara:strand:+ start:29720 stop:29974 length:255 start_codon:yes stop_codon:yes gene_type:complete
MRLFVNNRIGSVALLCSLLTVTFCPLTGCGNPDGIQDNPYAAPVGPAGDSAGETTVMEKGGSGTAIAPDENAEEPVADTTPAAE